MVVTTATRWRYPTPPRDDPLRTEGLRKTLDRVEN
jgi:hypothetical protein